MLFQSQIDTYAQKILDDYDAVNPSTIFKDNIKISNDDAYLIQSAVKSLREKRGEEVIGYKIGCISIMGWIDAIESNISSNVTDRELISLSNIIPNSASIAGLA